MNMIVSIYGERAYKKILLPAIQNADYKMILYRDLFALHTDLALEMENINGKWNFRKSNIYDLSTGQESYFGRTIQNNDIVQLSTKAGDRLTILVHEILEPFAVYKKYSLKNLRSITIGKDPRNNICYDYFSLVSNEHAVLELNDQGCYLYDRSSNGVFVNNLRVKKRQRLQFGDSVHILGLQMIYLGNLLAVEQQDSRMRIDESVLRPVQTEQLDGFAHPFRIERKEKEYFHRVPRNIEKLDRETIEIEEPPAPGKVPVQSMMLAVGPALSMAIPMLCGSLLSVYGSNSNSVMMYAGLITALSSALVGSVWAAANVKQAKKQAQEEEKERYSAYMEYLEQTMAIVKEKYEKNTRILQNRYQSASVCAEYGSQTSALWNRNSHHEDYLYHRVGIGRIPFQVSIQVPKEKFKIRKDDLATKPKDIQVAYETLKDVPVGIDFAQHHLIGMVGGRNKTGALEVARNLLIQIAASNCYTDVKLGVLYNRENGYEEDCLSCAKWLPHTWSEDKKTRYVADNQEDAMDVCYELTKVFRTREEEKNTEQKEAIPKPYYILFISDLSYLEGGTLTKYIFHNERKYGLSVVLLAEEYEELPNTCEFIVQNDQEFQGYYSVTDDISERVPVRFDEMDQKLFERFARRLSDIEVNEIELGGEIPNSLTFFDMMGVQKLEELDVVNNWRKNRTYDSMKALVGQKSGGAPCYLDIHEKYHGPHGLVAGTTGSGKSETLQTYILSLAINYSPNDVGFFVIDYKGGGMANLFSDLPHTIGQISNLSGNQVHRAMVSIKSENRRRQLIFNEHGVNNINNYTRLYKNNEASIPVPHLFIIIDEFAELKREEPEFMKELISVAQVGRSLGVHLILATQKPSGTVDDNIWSNAKFRLCLRVQDRQDSNDMLHKPDAAYITQAGRCYLQVGNDEVYELFQSGWSGAVYDENEESSRTEIAKMCSITGKAALIGNRLKIRQKEQQKYHWILEIVRIFQQLLRKKQLIASVIISDTTMQNKFMEQVFEELEKAGKDYPMSEYNLRRMEDLLTLYAQGIEIEHQNIERTVEWILTQSITQGKKLPEMKEKTQLDAVVEYLSKVAGENGYTNRFTLWMPVLPEKLCLKELKGYSQNSFDGEKWPEAGEKWKLEAYMGMIDDPVNQAQIPLIMNLSEGGNHAICGTVVTGKSTFLQTMVYSFCHAYSPDYINFYLLDFSSHMLGAFEELAHVGGVIYENDTEKLSQFFNMISDMIKERKELLQGGNYEQYVQSHGVQMPAIVIVIDQFSNFTEKTEGVYEEELIQISRNGTGYGIYLVMTSAGFGMTEIPNRIADNVRTTLTLEMSDKYQYADILHTLRIQTYPENGVKGRGLLVRDGEVLEYQTALCLDAEDDYTRSEKIAEECRWMNRIWKGRKARPIPHIPENPVIAEFMELESVKKQLLGNRWLPLGYNQENAAVYSIDLSQTFSWIIQGKARTGKTNVMRILMTMAVAKGADTAIIDLTGILRPTAQRLGVQYLQTEQEITDYWRGLLVDIKTRNAIRKEAIADEMEESEIFERMCQEKAHYLFIDDLNDFVELVYHPEKPENDMQGFLENITEKGRMMQIYLFAGLNQDKAGDIAGYGVFENMVRAGRGIHLGGNVASQRIMDFDYVPFNEQAKTVKPGTGQLPAVEGEVRVKTVVIPLDKKSVKKEIEEHT